ncbi:4-diphosphocytidyl-2-C-methyl-D-erythritol kinase [Virgibacillus pantothenticus]|uniref:4-diphosphocytidyl-2-C-methyl-D-erythritol kinase n=1 Tax=Virgibacillus pantothenticus TaxID=1473 RepID=A0A0L0QR28_VIRPA|nr:MULTISPECIES: 4-(cytidine 5'-diphospho)-2-C-methyl-D-erythritol kinase [Virgibacillus]API92311.1 4-(cytidine 5'-diphospho)-2-C-methyl-D-erythritol kinase [Virgibacillus sp. 6R]KNE21080.1 4-diphosphocytidyl-2C-methyl-D-erythritol kinase [Virgibacillus pantothenticus]MBS7427089.1 4-(cytidine 5'-diphospho)-2-C-methyl-D-erythritol kinase [Virgibacillus sp. 19R1-5]MBU8568150.1 4-(cytidine 5'-diphospho)-2-C-methyl-D-erythritol kinase [Virgibacillus pantothenticus]MBU8602162.1 4-(cytidine 5'-dipho
MVIFEKAPAKINLSLDVLSKRCDGYHNVEMIMTTIDLADRIRLFELPEDRIEISLESRFVPSDKRNLAYQAALVLKQIYGIRKGVHISIEKNIPVSAGLAGGSADAAAVLKGLNRLWELKISQAELAQLGALLGTDVPFCIYGRTGLAKGRGEIVEALPSPPPCWVVLAKPDIGVSSRTIFQRIVVEDLVHPETRRVMNALEEGSFEKLCLSLGNALEPLTMGQHPEVQQIKNVLQQAGASGVLMSGSGPTVYGLVEHESKAKRIYNGMRGFCEEVYYVRLLG